MSKTQQGAYDMLRLAIDTGGTFTDCVLAVSIGEDAASASEDSGRNWYWKALSTPDAPERAVMEAIGGLATQRPFELADVESILLATTVATNAILERKGARTALVTTRGFRDVLLIGRAKRYDTFDMHLRRPAPLVARRSILEVAERIGPSGEVLTPIDHGDLDRMVAELDALAPEAVAVSLLHAYANPAHEEVIRNRLAAWSREVVVSLSSSVSPKYREYERTSTTVANAYVSTVTGRFLSRLEQALVDRGFAGNLYAMQSNGGLLSTELARSLPVNMIESGPAAGVLLAAEVGRQQMLDRVLSFDMGGTTAKLGVVEDGEPTVGTTFEVDTVNQRPGSGLPLNIAAVELLEIGAGGGSIATVDLGLIRVGPESAGADPGPVCYGRNGTMATISDANLVLGYLDPTRFAGGRITLDRGAAIAAIEDQVAKPLKLSVEEAAWGIHAVANASMERAMRSMSIERGRDPRDYALVAFGGAGPIHACRLARALGVRRVIVPRGAGVGSAVGMLAAEPRMTMSLTHRLTIDATCDDDIARCFERLEHQAAAASGRPVIEGIRRHAYLRYKGQGYELRVELPSGRVGPGYGSEVVERFHLAYEQEYGYAERTSTVEAVDWYLSGTHAGREIGTAPGPELSTMSVRSVLTGQPPVPAAMQSAYFAEAGGMVDTPVYERSAIMSGHEIIGPAVITDPEATTLVPPGDRATSESGHLVIDIEPETRT